MAKNRKARRALEAVKTKYIEATGSEERPFTLPDGTEQTLVVSPFDAYGAEWVMPHPLFAPDSWKDAVDEAESDADKARAILGQDQYEKFLAAGGSGSDVMLMYMDISASMAEEIRDARGAAGPTRS